MLGDRPVTIKAKLLALAVLLALFVGTYYAGYLKGWYAHSDKVNSEYAAKSEKAGKAVAAGEKKAAAASAEGKVIYRTIYRDVVRYVNDPNHTNCRFDDHAVQLRQRALDAANSISGFDAGAVQGGEQSRN
ncbi:prophage protein [Citrobacter koseri]|uniref:Prophage protein n=1 Tax=Citrobacter koseri TaxID=545 RepID=A0A078LMD9_CITKO|nr:prophage protein [Citrobacter koseri]